MNNGSIIGRLVRDIETSYTHNNKIIAKGSIACNDKFNKEKTHYFNFTAFGKTAETMGKYLAKGSQVGIEYNLSHNTWTSKEGAKKSTVELIVQAFTFCGERKQSSNATHTPQPKENPNFENFDSEQMGNNEVPF